MKDCYSLSSSSREQGFEFAYNIAREQLSKISDMQEQCHKSGAQYVEPGEIVIDYLNQPYHITIPDVEISLEISDVEVPLKDKILILHYFNMAKGTPPTGILITYKQLPGGIDYFLAFSQRAINPLIKRFGQNPDLLINKTAKLGGDRADYGDASVTINAFTHVPINLVLWRGDEEVAPNGNILFDANISDYLSTEDVTVLCENITRKLVEDIPFA